MSLKSLFSAAALASAMIAAPALADQPAVPEASIPFANQGSIRDWRADGSTGIYVKDVHNQWYYARLMGRCNDLPFAEAVGFEARGTGTLDRFGTVIVRGQRCPFQSFVKSAGPPRKADRQQDEEPHAHH